MTLEEITQNIRTRVGDDCGLPKIVKFDFGDEGVIHIDGTASPNVVSNADDPADCTVKVSLANFLDIASGELNPQMAFMTGKLKVEGDMGVALQLGKILG